MKNTGADTEQTGTTSEKYEYCEIILKVLPYHCSSDYDATSGKITNLHAHT